MTLDRSADDSAAYLAARNGPDPWTAAAGQRGTQVLLRVETVTPPQRVDAALNLLGQQAVVRSRLMLLDDVPMEIADSYYPISVAAGTALTEKAKIRGGAQQVLADLGLAAFWADEEVELDSEPTPEESVVLGLEDGARVARLFRTAYAENGTPVEVATAAMVRTDRILRHRITVG